MIDFSNFIGESPAIQEVFRLIERVVQKPDVGILLVGETGTGKEVAARIISENSAGADHFFVSVNCAAIPGDLLESELFGYERGAFTGAEKTKQGLFELANGGTILLDEIDAMHLSLQPKLLRAIEEKSFWRLGGEKAIRVKARVIASTNGNLAAAIRAGNFREDLYYRLNEVQIYLPPLRERGDDVILMAEHFIREFDLQYNLGRRVLSDAAAALLKEYHWPGNVRELRNVIKRTMIMNDEPVLRPESIAIDIRSTDSLATRVWGRLQIPFSEDGISLHEAERHLIAHILSYTGWNKTRAARMLNISFARLARKIEQYELHPPRNTRLRMLLIGTEKYRL